MAKSGSLVTRGYTGFRGVDFGNDPGMVDLSRSPDALNVWKNYQENSGICVQTRPGYKLINTPTNDINGKINSFFIYNSSQMLVHSGHVLYIWKNFPEKEMETEILNAGMNNRRSYMYMINDKVYINDGRNFLVYNGEELKDASRSTYIPTTSIGRSPRGGGTIYEDVNVLNDTRKNTFVGDGQSTKYYLDAEAITDVISVKVNGESQIYMTDWRYTPGTGEIEFLRNPPPAPNIIGKDNVEITFTKHVEGYREKILNCTMAIPFDNRVFFAGNPDYPNTIFHSGLNNPSYISDLDYYEDGTNSMIKSLVVGDNILWVLKESNQNKDTIFYHTPTTDSEYGRIYPRSQGKITEGCHGMGFNFKDSIVFLSRNGLEGISNSITSLQLLVHKSTAVDNKMISMSNYEDAHMVEWLDYLVIAIDDCLFLADSKQTYQNNKGLEYEWYYWKMKTSITFLQVYNNELYFGDFEGRIYKVGGTNDNGDPIKSYWSTPYDQFRYPQYRKTTNKRGTILKVMNMQNGKLTIHCKTDRKDWKLLKEVSNKGFDFADIDFANFSFSTGDWSYVVFRVKQKKIKHISFRFGCEELDKGFGIYQLNTSAYLGSFVK